MFKVCEGKNDHNLARKAQFHQWLRVALGLHTYQIQLNGGSESRRMQIETWQEIARETGLEMRVEGGCVIVLGCSHVR